MKILHVITGLNVGGAEIMLYRFLRQRMDRDEDHVVLSLMPPGRIGDAVATLGITIHSAGMSQGVVSPAALWQVVRVIAGMRPDIIHGWMYHGNLAASIGARLAARRTPVIWSVHHSLDDIAREKRLARFVIRLCGRLSGSPAVIEYCSKVSAKQHAVAGFDNARAVVIPNAVDTAEFQPLASARRRLVRICGVSRRFVIGSVARSHPMKNHAALVRATADLLRSGHDVQTVIVGAGQTTGDAARAVAELGLEDRVTLLERRDDIADIVAGFDVYVLCSAWGEAFSVAAGEAMACGVPVVGTDVGDTAWLVGDSGRIVQPGDDARLADAIASILSLPDAERVALGAAARERICTQFSLQRYSDSHTALYANVWRRASASSA